MDAPNWQPGFFCCFQSAIGFLDFCEKEKPTGFEIFFEKGLYFDEPFGLNWWEYYFEPIRYGSSDGTKIEHVGDMLKSHWGTEVISNMTRESAAYIINKYIKIKPHIQSKIDNFYQNNFSKNYTIGVAYRGTDKSSEALRVSFEKVSETVYTFIQERRLKNYKIFVATDEQNLLDFMIERFGSRIIHIDAHRSLDDHTPVHHSDGYMVEKDRYQIGEEALMDCVLLSKTNVLIKTHSNLSSSAANFSPLLEVINLNHATYRKGLR